MNHVKHSYIIESSINQSSFIHGISSLKMLFQWAVYMTNFKRNYTDAKNMKLLPLYLMLL